MRLRSLTFNLVAAVAATLAAASSAGAHASYNIAGYGSGIGGSTNGADGMPATPGGVWTNGDPIAGEYTGSLPVQWYDGLHSVPTTRVLQTGGSVTAPPNGSLLQQTVSYNAANDPDLDTDRVLAVGGRSWSDPDNGTQGWGHGLDFGLIHVSPVNTILAGGPVTLTVSLQDDPTDGVVTRLAMALYGHWDSSASSSRHQTFTTQPAPTNDPLGATGLVLLGSAVGSASGGPVTLSIDVDETYEGEYTLMVGALGPNLATPGVSGQYIVTTSLTSNTAAGQCGTELTQCQDDLANISSCPGELDVCEADLATATADEDEDGVLDGDDLCGGTLLGEPVDQEGCSQAEFCAGFDATTRDGANACKRADWTNDEAVMKLGKKAGEIDCIVDKGGKGSADDVCVVPTP